MEVDFDNFTATAVMNKTEIIALNDALTEPINIVHQVTVASTKALFIVLGIDFRDENDYYYSTPHLKRKVNPLCIVAAERAVG